MIRQIQVAQPAVVSRREVDPNRPRRYLRLDDNGAVHWIEDPQVATAFESMREALRAATRLPAALCAYGVPHRTEILLH